MQAVFQLRNRNGENAEKWITHLSGFVLPYLSNNNYPTVPQWLQEQLL